MNTLLYLIRRILAAIPILILVGLITFLLIHLTPGDPAAVVAGENASLEAISDCANSHLCFAFDVVANRGAQSTQPFRRIVRRYRFARHRPLQRRRCDQCRDNDHDNDDTKKVRADDRCFNT